MKYIISEKNTQQIPGGQEAFVPLSLLGDLLCDLSATNRVLVRELKAVVEAMKGLRDDIKAGIEASNLGREEAERTQAVVGRSTTVIEAALDRIGGTDGIKRTGCSDTFNVDESTVDGANCKKTGC